ncbi:MAG: TetR/AcrR family transcriptional regulator [Actinobacteria bacterium]|nr:TetR/AcrR family transcriptional regulator [Actinomycetota bacterium]
MSGVRERARVATTTEIVRLAREQMAAEGAAALSLRAIARDMGMVSSGIYRYYASRDELLTALIIDSYERLGAVAEAADQAVRRRSDHRARLRAMAGAIRQFAIDSPSEWALLFGTPVPGYAAPQDTIGPATRYTLVLVELLGDIARSGVRHDFAVPRAMRADLVRLHDVFGLEVPAPTIALGLTAWAAIMGAVSLELFGHLHNVIDQPGALFDAVVDHYATVLAP